MKKLKMKSFITVLPILVFLLVFDALFVYMTLPSLSLLIKGPKNLSEIDFTQDIDDLYVTADLPGIYDWYAEESEGDKTTAREYIIDAGDSHYMGLRVSKKNMEKSEALLDASTKFFNNEIDEAELAKSGYTVKGTIHFMPTESMNAYYDFLSGLDEDAQSRFLPYYLEVGAIGDTDTFGIIIWLLLIALLTYFAVWVIIRSACGRYQKSMKAYIEGSGNPEGAKERIEYFLENTPAVNGLRYNNDFICGQSGPTTAFGETNRLVWTYQNITKQKRYFITVGKLYYLMLVFEDGSVQSVKMKKEAYVQEALRMLSGLCPKAIIGYSDELANLYQKDFKRFLN